MFVAPPFKSSRPVADNRRQAGETGGNRPGTGGGNGHDDRRQGDGQTTASAPLPTSRRCRDRGGRTGGLLVTPAFSGAADAAVGTRVTLPQSMVAAPAGASTVGPLSAAATLHVEVSLKVPDPQALQSFVDAVSTPGSPTYHQYLARGQFADRFGPSAEAVGTVRSWLASEGLKVGPTSANGLLVPVTGTAGQVTAAFGTTLSDVRLASGVTDYLATKAPSVVASVAGSVEGVVGLDDLPQVDLPRPPGVGSAQRAGPATGGREPTPAEGESSNAVPAVPATHPLRRAGPDGLQRRRRRRRWRRRRRVDPIGHRRPLRVLDPLRPGAPRLRPDHRPGRSRSAQRRGDRHLRAVLRHHHPGHPGRGGRGDWHAGPGPDRRGGDGHRTGGRPGAGQLDPHL